MWFVESLTFFNMRSYGLQSLSPFRSHSWAAGLGATGGLSLKILIMIDGCNGCIIYCTV